MKIAVIASKLSPPRVLLARRYSCESDLSCDCASLRRSSPPKVSHPVDNEEKSGMHEHMVARPEGHAASWART